MGWSKVDYQTHKIDHPHNSSVTKYFHIFVETNKGLEVIVNRSVKINLKDLINKIIVAQSSGDTGEVDEQKQHFKWFMEHSSDSTKESTLRFVLSQKKVLETSFLEKFFRDFSMSK